MTSIWSLGYVNYILLYEAIYMSVIRLLQDYVH